MTSRPKKWTTIRVPEEVARRIKLIKEKEGKVTWEVVLEAITFYDKLQKSSARRAKLPDVEKVSWYMTKLAVGYGFFVSNPCKETYEKLEDRVKELKERLGIDAELLLRMADYYMRAKTDEERKKVRIDMNLAYKQVLKDIIIAKFFEMHGVQK